MKQLTPFVRSLKQNGFGAQLRVSFLQRAHVMGLPMFQFVKTHRCLNDVGLVVSQFYHQHEFKLPKRAHNPHETDALAPVIRKMHLDTYDIDRMAVCVNVEDAIVRQIAGSPSPFNETTFAVTMATLERSINYGIELKDMAIITPWLSQVLLIQRGVDSLKSRYKTLRWTDLWVGMMDSLIGGERKYLIADTGIESKLGFLYPSNRPNSGFSCAQIGLIMICSSKKTKITDFRSSGLAKAWEALKKSRACYNLKTDKKTLLDTVRDCLPSRLAEIEREKDDKDETQDAAIRTVDPNDQAGDWDRIPSADTAWDNVPAASSSGVP